MCNTNYGLKGNVIKPKQYRLEGGRQPLLLPYDTYMFCFCLFYFFFLVLLELVGGPFSLSHTSINDQETPFFSLHLYIIFNQRPTLLPLCGSKKICAKEVFVQSFFGIVLYLFIIYLFIISFLIFFLNQCSFFFYIIL